MSRIDLNKSNQAEYNFNRNQRMNKFNGMMDYASQGDNAEESDNKVNADAKQLIKNSFSGKYMNDGNKKSGKVVLKKNKIGKTIKIIIFLPFILAFVLVLFIVIIVFSGGTGGGGSSYGMSGIASEGYYVPSCQTLTLTPSDPGTFSFDDEDTQSVETLELDDYVARAVKVELKNYENIPTTDEEKLEIYKASAVAVRTSALANQNSCVITVKPNTPPYEELTSSKDDELIKEAVEDTTGQVLLSGNSLYDVTYEDTCISSEDDDYYTFKGSNLQIPKTWTNAISNLIARLKLNVCNVSTKPNISKIGTYYLVTEEDYDFEKALTYNINDSSVKVSKKGGFLSSIAGLEIKDTVNATPLNQSLQSYLPQHGSSVEEMNAFIKSNVVKNGVGTRAGVVAAGVSIINFLYDTNHVKLPYYWNGKYPKIGVNPQFGGLTTPSDHGQIYAGFDCSGFVSWAIINGGFNFKGRSTREFGNDFASVSCDIESPNCIGQPGDLINAYNSHVQLIVSVDQAGGRYYIAESSNGLVMTSVPIHSSYLSNAKIIHMDEYYNNPANVNHNY